MGQEIKKVVVTGGCGLLGRYVVEEFSKQYDVTVLDLKYFDGYESRPRCEFHVCDVMKLDRVINKISGHDAVIHLAGLDIAIDAPDSAYFETNVMGTWNVLHAAEVCGLTKAVVCSSVSAIGINEANPRVSPDKLPCDETQIPHPTHPYGLSKQVMEVMARSFALRGKLSITALRPAFVLFPHLLEEIARAAMADFNIDTDEPDKTISEGSMSPTRSYVRPDDAARCFRLAMEIDTGPYDDFYVVASDTYSMEPTLDGIKRRFGSLPNDVDEEHYLNNPRAAALSNEKAIQILGWEPSSDWSKFLKQHSLQHLLHPQTE